MDLIIFIAALIVCYVTGSIIENSHYKNISEREAKLAYAPYISFAKNALGKQKVKNSFLVSSSVVVGCDYFKAFLAALRNFFGGQVSAYESVMDRGRREAVLRVREKALAGKANAVVNLKIDTVMLEPVGGRKFPKVCVLAYGTAIEYDK